MQQSKLNNESINTANGSSMESIDLIEKTDSLKIAYNFG